MSLLLKLGIGLLIAFVVLATLSLLFWARPTPVLGLDGKALAHSISDVDRCSKHDGLWICQRNSNIGYRVKVGWDGCWNATLYGKNPAARLPRTASGCVDLQDHIRLDESLD